MKFEIINQEAPRAKIRVIGIGGGGGNAVNTMISHGVTGVDFVVVNTDIQDLERSLCHNRIQLGIQGTKGLGTGGNPDLGREAATEDSATILELLEGCDMVFLTAGMGGGTGTGAAPVIAQIAREAGILTVAVVTKPFSFEGKKRKEIADYGLENLRNHVDTLLTIPNQKLINISDKNTTLKQSFQQVDQILLHAIRGVSDLINLQGLINVDFADVQTVMKNKGIGLMGVGYAKGKRAIIEASQVAINSPLLDDMSIVGAKNILINIRGGSSLGITEVDEATRLISEEAHPEAEVIFGLVEDENMGDAVQVTVIATEFEQHKVQQQSNIERRVVNDVQRTQPNPPEKTTTKKPMVSGNIDDVWNDFMLPKYRSR